MVDEELRIRNLYLEIDNLVQDKKSNLQQMKILEDLAEDKKRQIDEELQDRLLLFDTRNVYIDEKIKIIYEQLPYKETKTQKKLQLLSCDLIIKKSLPVPKVDNHDGLIQWSIENDFDDYYKNQHTIKLDWKNLKQHLAIVDGQVIHKPTGTVMDHLSIEQKVEELVIK